MNGYLLDTNIVSLLSPSSTVASTAFFDWLKEAEQRNELYLSVVTIHEIERGIGLLEHKSATAKASALRTWLEGLSSTYADRILPIDAAVSMVSGSLEARATANGHSPGMADALIAGTAKAHKLTVVTRDRKHFEPFAIDLSVPDL